MSSRQITLRGVEVHNLQSVDIDLPHQQLIVFCGVSGSGKTSLALDTLYAEGQRRYIESFSAYTRQFLERLEKPAAERIEGIPPAIAVTHKNGSRSSRSTVGTTTEITDYLRLLYAKIGRIYCHGCGQEVRRDTAESVSEALAGVAAEERFLVTYPFQWDPAETWPVAAAGLREDGFVRLIAAARTWELANPDHVDQVAATNNGDVHVVVDRLTGTATAERWRDSLETAFLKGDGRCEVFVSTGMPGANGAVEIDGRRWFSRAFSSRWRCEDCGLDYQEPEPRLFSFNSPLGACPKCEGFGNIIDIDMELVVPDPGKTLRDGAIAPWNTPAYEHELEELLALADEYQLPVDIPFRDLNDEHLELIRSGVPAREFGGLQGFFAWLERRKYKMHLRVFLSRWRSYRTCAACDGGRLRPEATAARIGGVSITDLCRMKINSAVEWFDALELSDWEREIGRTMLDQVRARLRYLAEVGVGYLTLDRTLRTLSGGETQRVALTGALGSSLVNMLYVLDEPSVGLHPQDVDRLLGAIQGLRDRGNSVVVVEHEEAVLRAADQLVELGPGAGVHGGQLVFQGTVAEMQESEASLTGDYLTGRRGNSMPAERRQSRQGHIVLTGASGNNLRGIDVEFPLGVLCVVTGVSGSGKSTLVQDTLYPAICRRMRKDAGKPAPFDDVIGDGQVEDVIMVDQSPIGRSPRSNPVTYIKAFDQIRAVFADTVEARTHNYNAGHFSFNVDGGRCTACKGDGYQQIDMQFLADVYMKCGQCGGQRYRKEILEVAYRGRNIADVLEMTVREAFGFFRGQAKAQARLKRLMDVGLDYLRLGQPANTLSGGEAQRLKLAGFLASGTRKRTLFILDEPTTGLHFQDIIKLLDCFDELLGVGHSLIVVEHNLQLMKSADCIIDLGPGAADEGGTVVAQGTPEQLAQHPESITGRFLAEAFAARLEESSA